MLVSFGQKARFCALFSMVGASVALTGCEEIGSGAFSAAPAFTQRERLPDSTVTIDDKEYTLVRNKLTYEGREEITWALRRGGELFDCSQPNMAACRIAIENGPVGEKERQGGMY